MLPSLRSFTPLPEQRISWRSRLEWLNRFYLVPLVYFALSAWLLLTCAQTIGRVVSYYTPLPMWDYWRVVENYPAYKALHLSALWRQHNEHRIIFPEIVFALDMLFLHGRAILPLVASFACYVATWALLASTFFYERNLARSPQALGIGLAGVVALWEGSAYVLGSPFLLQWTLMQLAVTATFVGLSRLRLARSGLALAGTIASAVIATYSSGNALALWPLVLCAAVLLRIRRRDFVVLLISATATLGLYFVGYHFSSALKLSNFTAHPAYAAGYIASYMSMPFGAVNNPLVGVQVGAIGFLIVATVFLVGARKRLLYSYPAITLLGYYVFTLMTAAITAGGRMDPTDVTFTAAKAPRYITVPQMNWAAVILLVFWLSSRLKSPRWFIPSLSVVLALLLAFTFPKLSPWLSDNSEFFAEQQVAALDVESGLFDTGTLSERVFPDYSALPALLSVLKENELSIFYHGKYRFLGQPVANYRTIRPEIVDGAITQAYPTQTGYEVAGWADISGWRRPYTWLVLSDESSRIIGFGRRFSEGLPNTVKSPELPTPLAWAGFLSSKLSQGKAIKAYIVAPRGRGLIPIAGQMDLPPIKLATRDQTGTPVPGVQWTSTVAGNAALPSVVDFGALPAEHYSSTWNGADQNTGTVRSSAFAKPPSGCLILPVVHGPSVRGISVQIQDAETGEKILALPLRNGENRWYYWRVSVHSPARSLSIEAKDDGNGWGQWVAISSPYTCAQR